MCGLSANFCTAMSMSPQQATIETNAEGVHSGRKAPEAEVARLTAILDQYPSDPQFEGMTEDEAMAYAIQVVDEVRQERKKSAAT